MKTVAEFKPIREKEQKLRNLCLELSDCPPIDSTKHVPTEKIKLFVEIRCYLAFWEWYVAEIDPQTGRCFGFVRGLVDEWGYFMLGEILESRTLEYRRLDPARTVDETLPEPDEYVTPCFNHPTKLILYDGFFTAECIRKVIIEAINEAIDAGEGCFAPGSPLVHPRIEKRHK